VHFTRGALLLLFGLVVGSRTVAAGDWPENYVVHEHSESPDGRYGVVVLSHQAAIDEDGTEGNATYLANLQTRKTLGEIRGTDYFENQNHRDLQVVWAPDSSTCILQYDGRYGFDSVLALELKDESFRQIDIGKHIQETLDRLFEGYVNAYFRFGPDHELKVRALSYTNPKSLPDQPDNYARFEGTFDLASDNWNTSNARQINMEQWDALQASLQSGYDADFDKHMIVAANPTDAPPDFTGSVFSSEQEKLDALDKMLNDVYEAVRFILSPDRFAKVKKEQIAWIKTRDTTHSIKGKSKLTEDRIRALQNLLW
jgi:uncharacterized protein YecT (DUF1311 family)